MLETSKASFSRQEPGYSYAGTLPLQELLGTNLSTQELGVCIDMLLHCCFPSYFQGRTDTCQDLIDFQTFANSLLQYVKELGTYKRAELRMLDHRLLNSFMHLIQMLSDALTTNSPLRAFLLDLLLQLSVEANIAPKYLEVQGIQAVSEHPVFVGGFGDVWKASFGGNLVALKTPRMPINQAKLHRNLCREALLWRQLRHPNILAFLGVCHSIFPCPAIVSPWMQNGTVLNFVKTNYEVERLDILLEISEAIAYLHGHSPPIIHQDIRCANVLIDEHKHAVLADFGLSRLDSEYFNTFTSSLEHGCIRWQAPELLFPGEEAEYPKPSCASDIWAFGMLMLELFTEKQPYFSTVIDTAVVIDIYHGRKPERPKLHEITGDGFSDRLWECMKSCWEKVPTNRLCAADICTSLQLFKKEQNQKEDKEYQSNFVGIEFDGPLMRMAMRRMDFDVVLPSVSQPTPPAPAVHRIQSSEKGKSVVTHADDSEDEDPQLRHPTLPAKRAKTSSQVSQSMPREGLYGDGRQQQQQQQQQQQYVLGLSSKLTTPLALPVSSSSSSTGLSSTRGFVALHEPPTGQDDEDEWDEVAASDHPIDAIPGGGDESIFSGEAGEGNDINLSELAAEIDQELLWGDLGDVNRDAGVRWDEILGDVEPMGVLKPMSLNQFTSGDTVGLDDVGRCYSFSPSASDGEAEFEAGLESHFKFGVFKKSSKSIFISASDTSLILGVDNCNATLLEMTYRVQITSHIEQDSELVRIDCTGYDLDVNKASEELQKLVEFQELFGGESKQKIRRNKSPSMSFPGVDIVKVYALKD